MKTKLFLSLSVLTAAFTVAQEVPVTPAQTGRIAQFKQLALQLGSEMKEATKNNVAAATSAMTIEKAKSACTLANAKSAMTNAKSACTLANAKAAACVAGPASVLFGGLIATDMYLDYKDKQAEATRLANRSYFAKASDYVSGLAQTAKANTWDTNYGFNHSGKVATVAGVAAVAGLSYLAYKKNPFGRAVVKTVKPTVPAPSSARKLSRI